jgi:hypothetical protein
VSDRLPGRRQQRLREHLVVEEVHLTGKDQAAVNVVTAQQPLPEDLMRTGHFP